MTESAALTTPDLVPGSAVPFLSIVVMAYDEAASVEPTVREIAGALAGVPGRHEILIVDDGSTDGTEAIADSIASSLPDTRVIHHAPNGGLGAVYRTGFAHARGTYVSFFPADGQFPATIIPHFATLAPSSDMVLGYIPGRRSSLLAKTLSRIERLLYRVLFGRMPRFQGVLMFRRTMLEELPLRSTGRGWAVLMELIIRASRGGYRLLSVPTPMRPRASGHSKVNNLRTIVSNTMRMLELRRLL